MFGFSGREADAVEAVKGEFRRDSAENGVAGPRGEPLNRTPAVPTPEMRSAASRDPLVTDATTAVSMITYGGLNAVAPGAASPGDPKVVMGVCRRRVGPEGTLVMTTNTSTGEDKMPSKDAAL